ncbi:hypothetical protein N7499_012004 [Penicillium canescens]|nr:hypothetical protein N7499_012004 [Penicillium canescens]KAJ6181832.1 hypothetical protein N7485_000474 [Penicillium canescens]
MDTYLVNRFRRNRGIIRVLTDQTLGNSAEFRPFVVDGVDTAFEMGLEGLCGCSIVVVVSKQAIWFAHIFEDNSFSPREEYADGLSPQEMFELTALNFLDTGIDAIFGVQFQSLKGVRNLFPVGDGVTSAFIVTPQKELDDAVEGGTGADTNVYYTEGLMYDWAVVQLVAKIKSLIPDIPVTVRQYQALNSDAPDADEAFNTRRGKHLFQYDPQARQGQKGVRLYLEGDRALNEFWAPEERSLSEPESQSTTQLSCAGQSYDRNQYTCYSDLLCPVLDGIRTLRCAAQCYLESMYTCYDEQKLCPVINGDPTLACGSDCYLPSEYSCDASKLVQIPHDNNPDQSASGTATNSNGDISSSPSSTRTDSITGVTTTSSGGSSRAPAGQAEVVFGGTTYTIGTKTTTIVQDGHTVILGPNGLIIGTDTITIPLPQTEPVALTTDGITITFLPGASSSSAAHTGSSSLGPSSNMVTTTGIAPGPTPTTVLPSSTGNPTLIPPIPAATSTVFTLTASDGLSTVEITYTPTTLTKFTKFTGTTTINTDIDGVPTPIVVGPGGLIWQPVITSASITGFPSIPVPTIPPAPDSSAATRTVLTITASDGLSTVEITYTPTTLTQYTTVSGTTTVTTEIDGVSVSVVVGPGGLIWEPVTTSTSMTGFPPIPAPTVPPAPQSSSVLPPQTITSPSGNPFPSSQFPLPPIVTTVVTSDSPDGPVATTITGTTDSSGVVVPITTLSTAAAVSSAKLLVSKLSSVSDAVVAFSSSPADSSKASSATAVVKDAQSGTSGFGHGLGFSLPGLCLIFCHDVSSAGSILDAIGNTLSGILDGTASLGSLTGLLSDMSTVASELADDAKGAEASDSSSSTSNPQPSITYYIGKCSDDVLFFDNL